MPPGLGGGKHNANTTLLKPETLQIATRAAAAGMGTRFTP